MELRQLGTSGLSTPRLVLSGNMFGATLHGGEAFAILDRFIAAGGTMVHTFSDISSAGESESVLGEWLRRRGRRDDVLIAITAGYDTGVRPEHIATIAEACLRRLGTDHIDLYHAQLDDVDIDSPNREPPYGTVQALDRLVHDGKVRAIGAYENSKARIAEALALSEQERRASVTVLEEQHNLLFHAFVGELQELAMERNLGLLAVNGLAWGVLSGRCRSTADHSLYALDRARRVIAALDEMASDTGGTPAQVALAWLFAQPGITAAIAGAASVEQLEELLGALTLVLDAGQIERLTATARLRGG